MVQEREVAVSTKANRAFPVCLRVPRFFPLRALRVHLSVPFRQAKTTATPHSGHRPPAGNPAKSNSQLLQQPGEISRNFRAATRVMPTPAITAGHIGLSMKNPPRDGGLLNHQRMVYSPSASQYVSSTRWPGGSQPTPIWPCLIVTAAPCNEALAVPKPERSHTTTRAIVSDLIASRTVRRCGLNMKKFSSGIGPYSELWPDDGAVRRIGHLMIAIWPDKKQPALLVQGGLSKFLQLNRNSVLPGVRGVVNLHSVERPVYEVHRDQEERYREPECETRMATATGLHAHRKLNCQ